MALAKPLDDAFLDAAEQGNLKQVRTLLQRGTNPNTQDLDGVSALMLANEGKHVKIVDLLLAKGASVKLQDRDGCTALSYGFSQDFIARFLAQGGSASPSDSGILNNYLESVIAIASGAEDDEIKSKIRLFIKAGVNLNHPSNNEFKTTPLIDAVQFRPNIVRLLLDLGADPNVADKSGQMPLMHTLTASGHDLYSPALRNHVCQLLLERGAKVNIYGEGGSTALMHAMSRENTELVQALLRRGAEPDFPDKAGKTPLILCMEQGFVAYTKLLLERGAKINLRDKKGHTALDYVTSKNINVVTFGQPSDKELTAYITRLMQNRQTIETLLRNRGGVNSKPVESSNIQLSSH